MHGVDDFGVVDALREVDDARAVAQTQAQSLSETAEPDTAKVSEWWNDVQRTWNQHIAAVRENIDGKKAEIDVDMAESRADDAEADALFAIGYAYSAIDEAEYAVLDATLARMEADDLATAPRTPDGGGERSAAEPPPPRPRQARRYRSRSLGVLMGSHHRTHAKANPSHNGTPLHTRLGRFLFPNRPRPPINPDPYGLLTMIVSLEAIFFSTFVMISQNRADARRQVVADQQWTTVQREDKENEELLRLSRKILALTREFAPGRAL